MDFVLLALTVAAFVHWILIWDVSPSPIWAVHLMYQIYFAIPGIDGPTTCIAAALALFSMREWPDLQRLAWCTLTSIWDTLMVLYGVHHFLAISYHCIPPSDCEYTASVIAMGHVVLSSVRMCIQAYWIHSIERPKTD